MDAHLIDIAEQIAALEAVEQSDEVVAILDELRQCRSALLEALEQAPPIEEDLRPIKPSTRSVQPWLMMNDELLDSNEIKKLRELISEKRLSGVDHKLSSELWRLIHSKGLKMGHLVAFGLRRLNGSFEWFNGIAEEFNYDSDHNNEEKDKDKDEEKDKDEGGSDHKLQSIKVSFAAPQHKNQLKCLHFDSGYCHFGTRCNLSHGHWITPDSLRPLFWDTNIHIKIDTEILFLPPDADLWEAGVVTSIKRSDKLELLGVEVLSQNGKNIEIVDMNRILPNLHVSDFMGFLPGDTTVETPDPTPDPMKISLDDDYDDEFHSSDSEIDSEINSKNCPEWFGFWEKYTKGFGSRMLMKMGYKMGGPLCPPSMKPNDPLPLIEPLPIRLLPPRVSLDYLTKRRKKGEPVGTVLEFRKSGDELIAEEQKRREALIASTNIFRLMNREEIAQGHLMLQRRHEKNVKDAEEQHQKNLQQTRSGTRNETNLRGDLIRLEQQLTKLNSELRDVEKHLERHTGRGTVIQLQAIYATTAAQKRHEIEKVTEKIKAIEERLHENKSVKKMKLF